MKYLIVISILFLPLFAFSQYNVYAEVLSDEDFTVTVFETNTTTCGTSFNHVSTQSSGVYSYGSQNFSHGSLFAYNVHVCIRSSGVCNGGCGGNGDDETTLGHAAQLYTDQITNCITGAIFDVTWTTHEGCKDIQITIEAVP